jgi:gluconolactonase
MSSPSRIETLVTGFGLIEGPRVDAHDQLYFSDVVRGGVFCRSPDGAITPVVPKRRGIGGIALHADGGVVVSGRSIVHVREGETRVLFESAEIPSFNDIFSDADGRVLAGSMRFNPFSNAGPRDPGELYRIDREGQATLLLDDIGMANGIGLSEDGRLLFMNDSSRNEILCCDVDEHGACSDRRVFAHSLRGTPDGLAVDEAGGVWIAGHGGACVSRFRADGALDRHVDVPAKIVTSLCLGGPDRRDLYIVSADNTDDPERGGSVFRTRVDVPGVPIALVRI